MSVTEVDKSAAAVTVRGELSRGSEARLEVIVGQGVRSYDRFLEFRLPDTDASVRADWDARETRKVAESTSGFVFTLTVNRSQSEKVIYADGLLYHHDRKAEKDRMQPFHNDELLPFWDCFTALGLHEKVVPRPVEMMSFGDWLGCMADSAGAGAGIGAGIGLVGGGPPGAATGGAVGGALGGSFGLGYCTTKALLD
jgi:hypothetical protein